MSEALFSDLGELITQRMAQFFVPGVAVGVLYEGRAYTAGFGVTNVAHPLAVDEHTLFQIGSTTKTVTGTAIMRLADMGKLNLDTPVRHYLPDFKMLDREVAKKVTLRHLLNHTGGWAGDLFLDTGMGDDALAAYVREMASLPQLTPLGSLWTYNNSAFSLAGRIIEVVTGQPYEAAVTELVLDPLEMEETFLFPQDIMTLRFASGHFKDENDMLEVARPWALARSAHSAGGIVSTAHDQLRYAQFHLGDGKTDAGRRLLPAAALAAMQQPTVKANLGNHFGISWFIKEIEGVRIVLHGGSTRGQHSAFLMVPAHQFAITVLTNSDQGAYLHDDVTKWALKRYLDLESPQPEAQPRSVEELAAYAGEYDAQLGLIALTLQSDVLVKQYIPYGGFPDKDSPPPPAPPPTRIAFTGPDEAIDLDPPHTGNRSEFIRSSEGQIRWLRTSRLHRRL